MMIDSGSLPPLNTLRVFEAVARHLSFTQAAKELHVTQAAVSHQIKSLEDHFGIKLFSRIKRRVLMTEEAQMLLPAVISAFSSIREAVEVIREHDAEQTLAVSLTPQFASNWLSFRIGTFYKRHPDINLHLQISSQEPDFVYGKTDLGVYWGSGNWEGLQCERLMTLEYTPFCSPELLDQEQSLKHPLQLASYRLLHEFNYEKWKAWLQHAGADEVRFKRGSIFEDTNLLIHAAIDGKGVALCGLEMVQEHLESGRLIRLFDESILSQQGYYVVFPRETLERPLVNLFRDWLMEETEEDSEEENMADTET
ncbi:MAG: transcriptional regulator GcvA, partial [SAR324 cluster bacterium]|nr:transcriptional regulator GcvA [SAR324 cluster bacterium]